MTEAAMIDETPASWRTIRYGSPVVGQDLTVLGTVAEVLGSDAEDIFHGIRLRVAGGGRDLVVPSGDVTDIAPDRVATSLVNADVAALEPYDESSTYHLASVGWLRRHLGWEKDTGADEEPG
jgi:hypothetical protein